METYKLIKNIEKNIEFLHLIKRGIIPLSILNKKCFYERYLQESKTHKKCQAITNTAEEFNVSEMTIRRAIDFMTNLC